MSPASSTNASHGRGNRRGIPGQGGFTLVEVMIALAILSVALVGMMAETATNIRITQEVSARGNVVDLLRGKVYDIEAELMKDGFQDLDQSSDGDFSDEGYGDITWEAQVEKIEIPGLNALTTMQGAEGEEGGEAGASGSPLVDLMAGFGGGLGSDGAEGASFIASQFEMLTRVLEASIRKVTVSAKWKVGGEAYDMVVAIYLTDPNAIDKVLQGFGSEEPATSSGDTGGTGGTTTPGRGSSTTR